jgi:hypothetical protein
MKKLFKISVLLFCPLFLLNAEVPKKYKDLIAKTGIKEGQYLTVDKKSKDCDSLEIRFLFPEDAAPSIIDGASPLFESLGKSNSYTERDCKRTIKSKLERNKISQHISVECKKKGNYTFHTSSELNGENLKIIRKVTKNKEVTESSSCTYKFAKKY